MIGPVKNTATPIVMTVDLEDWFQVENARSAYPVATWDSCDLHVGLYTKILLDIFEYYDIRCTFFVLGWLAERVQEHRPGYPGQGPRAGISWIWSPAYLRAVEGRAPRRPLQKQESPRRYYGHARSWLPRPQLLDHRQGP